VWPWEAKPLAYVDRRLVERSQDGCYQHAKAVIVAVGAATAFFAASVALVQNDIKRVIAYSTCSQLGYMFFAAGSGAYGAAMFHLFTHAFFKALLFLGAGSVIHAMHHEQDMRFYGGLRKHIPITFWMMTIGTLALTGFFFTAGYYSKDAILEAAFASGTSHGTFAFFVGALVAALTSFYSWRLVFLTFFGKPRWAGSEHILTCWNIPGWPSSKRSHSRPMVLKH
jgi:NADH-quinone oxidoreductase subunit L